MTGCHTQHFTHSCCFELHVVTPLRCSLTLKKKFVFILKFINIAHHPDSSNSHCRTDLVVGMLTVLFLNIYKN